MSARRIVPGGEKVVPAINRIAQKFANVVLTQDWHPSDHVSFAPNHAGKQPFQTIELDYGTQVLWPTHCVQGTAGAEFHRGIDVDRANLVVRKGFRRGIDSYSALFENDKRTPTGLLGYLRERELKTVFVAGLALDFCVRFSAEDARKAGFEVAVIEDACRGIDLDGSVAATWGVSENNRKARYYELTARGRARLRTEEATWRRYAEAVFRVLEPA